MALSCKMLQKFIHSKGGKGTQHTLLLRNTRFLYLKPQEGIYLALRAAAPPALWERGSSWAHSHPAPAQDTRGEGSSGGHMDMLICESRHTFEHHVGTLALLENSALQTKEQSRLVLGQPSAPHLSHHGPTHAPDKTDQV